MVGTPSLFPPDPLVGSDGARGSGCSPGPGALPDGVWFGFVDGGAAVMDFDLACFYFGDIAWEKAAEQGDEAPNDFYISNQSTARRTVALDAATPVHWITADVEFALSPYGDWVADPAGYSNCPGEFCLVWLYVNGGAVTEILEQYLP